MEPQTPSLVSGKRRVCRLCLKELTLPESYFWIADTVLEFPQLC